MKLINLVSAAAVFFIGLPSALAGPNVNMTFSEVVSTGLDGGLIGQLININFTLFVLSTPGQSKVVTVHCTSRPSKPAFAVAKIQTRTALPAADENNEFYQTSIDPSGKACKLLWQAANDYSGVKVSFTNIERSDIKKYEASVSGFFQELKVELLPKEQSQY